MPPRWTVEWSGSHRVTIYQDGTPLVVGFASGQGEALLDAWSAAAERGLHDAAEQIAQTYARMTGQAPPRRTD